MQTANMMAMAETIDTHAHDVHDVHNVHHLMRPRAKKRTYCSNKQAKRQRST